MQSPDGFLAGVQEIGNERLVLDEVARRSGLEAVDTIKSELEAAGLTANGDIGGTTDAGATLVYSSDKWGVLVLVASDKDNGTVANYTVTATQK